jgi:hypothetical protein
MSDYFLAPALGSNAGAYSTTGLFGEINKRFPNRDHASDGWIGDASHAARASDHNPDWSANGIVRAIDVDIDDNTSEDLRKLLLNTCIGDPRVWYVISNRVIYSRTYGWAARAYTGSNPHDHHVHISLLHHAGEFDTSPWFENPLPKIKAVPVSLSKVREQFLRAAEGKSVEFNNGVGRIQKVLNRAHDEDLVVDGLVGKGTLNAWGRFEESIPASQGLGRNRVPDKRSLPALAKGRFRVVD